MRTRFLTPNYFTPVTAAETLGFLRFPLSPLSAVSASVATSAVDFYEELLRSAVDSVSCAVDLHLDNLPVDEDALSKFYADVLPHTIDVDYDGFPVNVGVSSEIVDVPEVRQTIDVDYDDCSVDAGVNRGNVHFPESESYSCCTKNPAQSCSTSYSESLDNQFSEESKEATGGDKIQNRPVIVQFEIPELSLDVENACLSEKENNLFLSESHAHDDNLELLNLIPMDQFDLDSKEVLNSVETICQEYDLAQKLPIPEDVDLLPKNSHPYESCDTVFPLLEVDETGAVDFTRFCVEDEWHSLVVTMEEHHSASHDDLELSCQNLLVSVNTDILEQISGCHTSKLPLEFCLTRLNLTVDADFLQLIEDPYRESNIWTEDSFPIPFLMSIQFEEFKMFDPDPFDIFDALAVPQTDKEPKTCDQLLNSNQLSKSFDELIASPELAIIDGTFTSLPVPTLVDDEKTWSVETIVDTVLAELEQLPFSTSDEIYLDWYLLGSDKYSGHLNTEIEKVFSDLDDYTIKTNLEPSDCGIVLLEFLLSEYSLDKVDAIEDKLDMPSGQSFTVNQRVNHTATKRLLDIDDCQFMGSRVKVPEADVRKVASSNLSDDDDCQIIENYQLLRDGEHGKVASSQLMPQVNDLDFFLNPRKAASGMRTDQRLRPQVANFMLSGGPNKKAVAEPVPSSSINIQKFHIQLHRVTLSDNILILIDNLRRTYLAMIREDTQLSMTKSAVTDSDDMNLLRIPEHTLMDHMNRSLKQKSCMGHRDDKDVIFVTLCAIKRMAWCLCIYGIYNLHIFLCKLFESLPFLKSRLFSIYTLVEDAKSIVDKELTKSHPSLTIIKEILRQYSNRSRKILILAQPDSWRSLKRLLSSMNISCVEVDLLTHGYQSDPSYDLFAGGGKDHTQTACALVKHKHISPSILTQNIDLIIECGGPCGVSKLSTLHSEHIGSQNLHFVKIELDDVARALCEGVNVTSSDTDTIQLEGLLNFGPLVESSNIASAASAGGKCDSLSLPVCQIAQESEAVQACDTSFPDLVIIVNTENFEKEMIISRRGTYQKILSMEKRGVQVVERDLMLPIDIILDAVTCIVWYDSKNIGKKSSAEDEGSSSVPLCIENIATNVLTSLSFTFTASVLVFEGDSNFLGTVMESADELYAAAASLGIKIQILYSYSFELTDEIILNYIGRARNECKGSLPTLPETETNIEYFLTRFPSINPLSAHAIISCGCMLLEYLEWSNDCRIHELRKYNLPEESINLLSILLKYGEREETKSGLTDCSSSMSSPPDSEKFTRKVNSVDRKRKLIPKSYDTMHDYKGIMTSDKCIEELDYFDSPSDSKVPKSPRISLQKKLPGFVMDEEVFGDRDRPRASASMNPSKAWPESSDPRSVKAPQFRDPFAKSTLPVNDCFGEPNLSRANELKQKGCAIDILPDLHDFVGEVVDIYDKSPFDMDFLQAESSPVGCESVENHAPGGSKLGRKLSFDSSAFMNFPMVDDLNTNCGLEDNRELRPDNDYGGDNWGGNDFKPQQEQIRTGLFEKSMKNFRNFPMVDDSNTSCGLEDNRELRPDNDYSGVDYNWGSSDFKPQQEQIRTGLFEKSMKNFRASLSKEKFVPSLGETPLSKAVHSAQLQQGSPWTMEFLNRIKEKRRLRQQNQPWDTSAPPSGNQRNISKGTKRRSPSILEYYKYQGGTHDNTPRKLTPQRLQNQHGQLSNEKPSGLRPTWTPVDKRARRSLSYATSGAGGQTKLVWNENISHSQDSRFSN